ncbi:Fe-S cluster assembly protein SufB [Candidatus Similichlamydia laticola]|uniref:Iron-sulfur cluster assembly protein SufB n=1 Tax=Candidatus Similichlamydia laticola TaxID=2170265 RepID=A0A369KD78_9BACT|nr:Fe-S cluster assembly protein SufB [Candidatus Similichlamydia laticola]RDB31858.1 Iron-sulfur cluster assembly protein SufB [Candidatus Similichlamydia laticola]
MEYAGQSLYRHGFSVDLETEALPPGLNEEVIRSISTRHEEPDFLLQFRLEAYRLWQGMAEPNWGAFPYPNISYNDIVYFAAPKRRSKVNNLSDVDPEVLRTFDRLGIPLEEQKRLTGVAIDAVFDSVSVVTTFKEKLKELGVLFCSFSEAVRLYPDIVRKYLGTVVPRSDNFFAALNSAVFSDGSFVYVPAGVSCPMDLVTYFRINNRELGQFERTLIVVEAGGSVSYLEGCTAPERNSNQLHAAVVELVAHENASIRYSTVQNWYAGDPETGEGGIWNFVTKRGICLGHRSRISWNQVEMGAAITWKYPSVILQGDDSVGEFLSVALTTGKMMADTGTKMVHLGKRTSSTIISKGISADYSRNTYRGLVSLKGEGSQNYTQCDSMLIGAHAQANTFPDIRTDHPSAKSEHEASTSAFDEEKLFYLATRGFLKEDSIQLVVTGFCKDVIEQLPLEFAKEMAILGIKLEGSVG